MRWKCVGCVGQLGKREQMNNAQHLQENLLLLIEGNADHKQDDALRQALSGLGSLISMCDDPDYHRAYDTAVSAFEELT